MPPITSDRNVPGPLDIESANLPHRDALGGHGWHWANIQKQHGAWLLTIVVCLLWLLPGLWGREPWKPDEAYTIAIIHHFYLSTDWLVPILGGQPFMEKPPLFFWTGAVFAHIFSPLMPFVDAARLAAFFYVSVTLLFVSLMARELYDRTTARLAPLMLIACLGFLYRGHELFTDIGLLAGFAIALYGMALCLRRPLVGGILLGIGTGAGFMCKGLIAPGVLGLTFIVLPLVINEYRDRCWWHTAIAASLAALPWLLIWPSALYLHSPTLFHIWFWNNNLGRFIGWNHMGGFNGLLYYPSELTWMTLPALPLSLYALWRMRARWRTPPIALPLLATLVTFSILEVSSGRDDVYSLPLLIPLSVLGAFGAMHLPTPGARLMRVACWLLFGTTGAFLWCTWFATLNGHPAFLPAFLDRWLPDNSLAIHAMPLILAVCYTTAWLWIGLRTSFAGEPTLLHWVMGTALVWCLVMTLWLPALNASKSYASVMAEMAKAFPSNYDCVATWGVGDSERGMLAYYEDINTQPFYTMTSQPDCQLLLVETPPGNRNDFTGWRPIWNGARPHDTSEYFWLLEPVRRPLYHSLAH
ncbi:MAG TPA: glycosyltransferase family 39 protein [Gammaproteobacteria bacterium]|nr:glycosyltransferase family 39 protein [Gammaproteobacteria bacterium]